MTNAGKHKALIGVPSDLRPDIVKNETISQDPTFAGIANRGFLRGAEVTASLDSVVHRSPRIAVGVGRAAVLTAARVRKMRLTSTLSCDL